MRRDANHCGMGQAGMGIEGQAGMGLKGQAGMGLEGQAGLRLKGRQGWEQWGRLRGGVSPGDQSKACVCPGGR